MGKVERFYVTQISFFNEKYNCVLRHKNNLQHSNVSFNLFNKPTARSIALATNCCNWHSVPSRIKAN